MKLLSQSEVKKVGTREKERLQGITDYISQKEKELNTIKTVYQQRKKEIIDDFLAFEADSKEKRGQLLNKAISIEKRMDIASTTVSGFYVEAEGKLEQAVALTEEAERKEKNADKRTELADKKVSDVEMRERLSEAKNKDLEERENTLKPKEDLLTQKINDHRQEIFEWREKKGREEKTLDEQFKAVEIARHANDGVLAYLKEREKRLEKKEEEHKIMIVEERNSLDAAWREVNQIKNK